MVQILPSNTFTTAKWIVSPSSSQGTHTTIQGAINSASSGDTIFILPSTYTEDLTLKAGVNLTAYTCDSLVTAHVVILGTCTMTTAGSVVISGITLQTNSAAFLAVTGSAASKVRLINCSLICANNTGITYSSSDAGASIQILHCLGDIQTTGIALFTHTSAGGLNFEYTHITNTGASTTSSTTSGSVSIQWSLLSTPLTTSSAGTLGIFYSSILGIGNTTCVTLAGTGSLQTYHSKYEGGSASAISIGTGTTATITLSDINSSNTNAITGAGTLNYSGISFTGSSVKINTTTQTGGVLQGGVAQAPSAGFIGEQLTANATAVSISNNTAKTITSVSLTAGIWDITGMADFSGTLTGTSYRLGISATNNTMPGTGGVNQLSTPTSPTAASNSGLCICPQRVTLTGTTTYYLVAFSLFSVGTATVSGIITATRVG